MDATSAVGATCPAEQPVPPVLEYAHSPAGGRRLAIHQPEEGRLLILCDTPRWLQLWTEFIGTVFASGVLLFLALMLALAVVIGLSNPRSLEGAPLMVGVAALFIAWILRVIWNVWRTTGTVTVLEVNGPRLMWSRRVLWGGFRARCRLCDVVAASVVSVRRGRSVLLIERRRGEAVDAFEGSESADLFAAAQLLNDAIASAPREASS